MSNIVGHNVSEPTEEHDEPLVTSSQSAERKVNSSTAATAMDAVSEELDLQNDSVKKTLTQWRKESKEKPLRVMVCGLGGVGKSTLVNHLLQLKNEKWAEEGRSGAATTAVVSKYERKTERGKVCIFDTPGFGDLDMEDEEIIAMMESSTEKNLDIVLYCISLDGRCRVDRADMYAINILTKAFTCHIWEKAVIVLTFANKLEANVETANKYKETTLKIKEKVQQLLKKDIQEDIAVKVPIVTAGHSDKILKFEVKEYKHFGGWDNRLFIEALKQVDVDAFPALLEMGWRWSDHDTAALGGTEGTESYSNLWLAYINYVSSYGRGLPTFYLLYTIMKEKYKQWKLRRRERSTT